MNTYIANTATLGRALREARRARAETQAQVSEAAGISQPTLSAIERGASTASLGTLLRLLAVLDLELLLRDRSRSEESGPWGDV